MITIEEMQTMLDEIAAEFPPEFFNELNGGIILLPEARHNDEYPDSDLYTLGMYHRGGGLGRYISIYYGSFMRVHGYLSADKIKEQLRSTVRHEFRHHFESLAGNDDLERLDKQYIDGYISSAVADGDDVDDGEDYDEDSDDEDFDDEYYDGIDDEYRRRGYGRRRGHGMTAAGRAEFQSRQAAMIGESRFRKYAVLAPIVETADGKCLLFEKRSAHLRRQPGEICFPGGKLESGEDPLRCAVRETTEELRVEERQIDVLGPGDIFVSPFNIIIYPFIGALKEYRNTYNPDEVAEVLAVPIGFFLKNPPETYGSTIVNRLPEGFPYERIPGGEHYPWASGSYDVLFYQYNDLVIWGITAYIVQSAVGLIDTYGL